MKLTATTEKFVLHWGEMGTKWGIHRTVAVLRECVSGARQEGDPAVTKRLRELCEFVELMSGWYGQMRKLPPSGWKSVANMGGSVGKLLGLKR